MLDRKIRRELWKDTNKILKKAGLPEKPWSEYSFPNYTLYTTTRTQRRTEKALNRRMQKKWKKALSSSVSNVSNLSASG